MILTGKAKSDFESWLQNRNCNLFDMIRHRNIDKLVVSAYIIEWFDELGLWQETLDDMVCNVFDGESKRWGEIVEQTIERANKFYNLTH
jgi:hypothetical protein